MTWIIATVALYCVFAAALIIILSIFSSRLSREEAWDEVWEAEPQRSISETKKEHNYSHLSSSA
ncbi:MAG TPA: hypothetical protein VK879_00430 [Candidatus Sulfomarinibacteraceae bacterium]|nr:hypothetical protein [Candidatus Sulfomarinibacteraceae bacterium]